MTTEAPEQPTGVDPHFAAGSSCSVKPHKAFRDTNGQIHLTRLTEKGG